MDISIKVDEIKFNFRVGAILSYQERILIEVGENVPFAVIPGGRVKTMEDTKEALDREIKEELGIDISNLKSTLISVVENFFELKDTKYHELYFIYKIELDKDYNIQDGMLNLDSYGSKYYWKTKEELNNTKMLPVELKEIAYANEFKKYIVRDI